MREGEREGREGGEGERERGDRETGRQRERGERERQTDRETQREGAGLCEQAAVHIKVRVSQQEGLTEKNPG